MMANKTKTVSILMGVSAALVLVGLILSILSSRAAYSLSKLNTLALGACVACALYAVVSAVGNRLPEALRDALLLAAVLATSLAMCTLIEGRTTLMGYIYFSDLESNNPVAVNAMNLAIAGVAADVAAIVLTVVVGFTRVGGRQSAKP